MSVQSLARRAAAIEAALEQASDRISPEGLERIGLLRDMILIARPHLTGTEIRELVAALRSPDQVRVLPATFDRLFALASARAAAGEAPRSPEWLDARHAQAVDRARTSLAVHNRKVAARG
jgi:hypothetical protein